MSNEKTTLDTLYVINGSSESVTLEVIVGAKDQTSDMSIMLDDTVIADKLAGSFKKKSLGTNEQLNGKKLSILATISDTSRETNLTSLLIRLRGGVDPGDFPLSKNVNDEGGSQDYICLIEFFNPLV